MTDRIAKAFANIDPSVFVGKSAHFLEHQPGPETFEQFLNRHLYSVGYAFVAAEGVINPISALSDGRIERLFAAQDEDTLGSLLERMEGIAQATGSTRFFWSRLADVTTVMPTEDQNGADSTSWTHSLLWYAEDAATKERRQGAMRVVGPAELGPNDPHDRMAGDFSELLHQVLSHS